MKTKLVNIISDEIISLEEAKNYLKLDDNYDENFLLELIKSAREAAENFLSINLIKKEFEHTCYRYSGEGIKLKQSPISEIKNVYLIENSSEREIINPNKYVFLDHHSFLKLTSLYFGKIIAVNYIAGYEENIFPSSLKTGMLLHIESIYDQGILSRGIPHAAMNLYNAYRSRLI